MTDPKDRPLDFDEFPAVSTSAWEQKIKTDLNDGNYRRTLRWHSGEGIAPLPFYRRENLKEIPRHQPIPKILPEDASNEWEIREPVSEASLSEANVSARKALNRGSDALQFHLDVSRLEDAPVRHLTGIPIQCQSDFSTLVNGISLETISLHFDAGLISPALLAMLFNEVHEQELNPQKVRATFNYDPATYLLHNGRYPKKKTLLSEDIVYISRFVTDRAMSGVRPLAIDARSYHNSGATIIQELGFATAAASEYLSILTERNVETTQAGQLLHFNFSAGSNYFLEIAKFRAARLLWKNLVEAYGGVPGQCSASIHAETSQGNKTLYAPYTNMLRTATEGMSAAIAGCNSITIRPFDQHFRKSSDFSQRIARNQQLIFREEAYLDKVADPAAGSYYIECLTDEIGRKAWDIFREVEAEGGLMQAIENGTVQSAIEDSKTKRNQAIARRRRTFVGTNRYTSPEETMHENIDRDNPTVALRQSSDFSIQSSTDDTMQYLADAFARQARLADVIPLLIDSGAPAFPVLEPYRGPRAFEELRLATDKHPTTPTVLMLPLGDKKQRKARSAFASNFFGCLGYRIKSPTGFDSLEEGLKAIEKQKPDIAVLCSSDDAYNTLVPKAGAAISKVDRPPMFVLAGKPGQDKERYEEAGVDEFIYEHCNALKILRRFQKKLRVI
ncbi:methylmalonyl-CoA mutase family protein [Fodinibius sediminis]|uniref:methylmalonyl-CoA mutase n=1 Tax=Fodinibius sediminis TaxID=1214077 RepID=A0A521AEY1_9BACT|nr:methylmalonyl-CoA mutase family protein [Fodinibius sediminis]SMO33374.1 heterodimeric methylmalonyl-CoA mutase small subunit [Fodinibius sediminis]